MKTASSELFDLIQSLSSRERAYFKRFASMHKQSSNSTYLKLFDAICEQEKYDEKELKEQFKNDNVRRYFPRAKKYLYDKILEAMGLFHAEASASVRLKRQINNARFLYSKQLFKQALKKAQQIKKEAADWEYWAEYMAALEIETSVLSKEAYVNVSYSQLQAITKEAVMALEKYSKGFTQYFYQKQMVYLMGHQTAVNLQDADGLFQQVMSMEMKGVSGQITQTYTMGLYAQYGIKNMYKAIEYFDKALELFEQRPIILFKGMDYYLFLVSRLLELNREQSSFDDCQKYLQKITTYLLENEFLLKREEDFRFAVKVEYHYHKLSCLFNFGKYEHTLAALADSNEDLKGKVAELHVAHAIRHHYICMMIYFFHQKFDAALEEANYALSLEIGMHPLKEQMQLWLLFIHWELGNYNLLENLIRNTVRYWRKRDLYNEWKQFSINILQKLMKAICKKTVWKEMVSKLEPLNNGFSTDIHQQRWFVYVMSKLEKKPMTEVHLRLLQQQETSNENMLATVV